MYTNCEESMMIESSVAVCSNTPVYVNEKGEVVNEEESTGYKSHTKLTNTQCCFAFDETGNNTSMDKDGNILNMKVIRPTDSKNQICGSTKEKHCFHCHGSDSLYWRSSHVCCYY